jgi:Uma2 family endonuclease
MDTADRIDVAWTADAFLASDQHIFGDAWRYELVNGKILAHDAPTPEHGAIAAGLNMAIATRLRGNPDGCRPEIGSGAAPLRAQRNTARIPDITIRCRGLPRVVFEVISPSELRNWRARDQKRRDLQDVEGVQEIVEVYQGEVAVHLYRRLPDATWLFEAIGDAEGVLTLKSIAIEIPLKETYEFALFNE